MTRKCNVVKMFKVLNTRISNWEMTPKRRLAQERNWCYRILHCIEALCEGPLMRFGASTTTRQQLLDAVRSVRYSIDLAYYDQLEEIDRRSNK